MKEKAGFTAQADNMVNGRIRASRAVGTTVMRSCQEGVFLQYDIYNCRCSQTLAQPIAIAADGRPLWPYITLKDDAH